MKELFIITGATGGMGYEAAKAFCSRGKLLLLDISLEALEKVKEELGTDIDILQFDITNKDNISAVVEYLKLQDGFNYLLHFAGVSESIGNSELIYKINLIGTKLLLDALYDYIRPNGVIINTSSMTGHMTPVSREVLEVLRKPFRVNFLEKIIPLTTSPSVAYGWSKCGVMELTKAEGAKWGQKGARIISISPGAIMTPMVEMEMKKNKDAITQLVSVTPMSRIGLPKDITNLVDFLISDKASFITGTDILIDGGATEVFKSFKK